MEFLSEINLKPFNTFGIAAKSDRYISIESEDELIHILPCDHLPVQILGGGSNILLKNELKGTIIHNNILGKTIIDEDQSSVLVRVGGGENWHSFVLWTLDQKLFGLENLSLIPGKVGAAPIQNIGAYGVEQNTFFAGLEAIELSTGVHRVFNPEECTFGYRDSYFKQGGKGKYCITAVYYRLLLKPELQLGYGAITKELEARGIEEPSPKDVSDVVITIRQSKLPDPAIIGNGGSFFKNPILPTEVIERLKSKFPDLPTYPISTDSNNMKTSAAWLIDQCGWKGKRMGNSGTYENHALVLVNHGDADGEEIWNTAQTIIDDVKNKFEIELEPEVNIW